MKGSLRIRQSGKSMGFADLKDEVADDYISRLTKLVPSDSLALYLFGESIIPTDNLIAQIAFAIACLLFVLFTRYSRTKEVDDDSPQWSSIIISMISFIIWVYVIGELFDRLGLQVKWFGSLIMAFWVSLTPYFYKGSISDK